MSFAEFSEANLLTVVLLTTNITRFPGLEGFRPDLIFNNLRIKFLLWSFAPQAINSRG